MFDKLHRFKAKCKCGAEADIQGSPTYVDKYSMGWIILHGKCVDMGLEFDTYNSHWKAKDVSHS